VQSSIDPVALAEAARVELACFHKSIEGEDPGEVREHLQRILSHVVLNFEVSRPGRQAKNLKCRYSGLRLTFRRDPESYLVSVLPRRSGEKATLDRPFPTA